MNLWFETINTNSDMAYMKHKMIVEDNPQLRRRLAWRWPPPEKMQENQRKCAEMHRNEYVDRDDKTMCVFIQQWRVHQPAISESLTTPEMVCYWLSTICLSLFCFYLFRWLSTSFSKDFVGFRVSSTRIVKAAPFRASRRRATSM